MPAEPRPPQSAVTPSAAQLDLPPPGGGVQTGTPPTPKNICCVGDDDQSIYGWRGAEVDNILRFEHDFPGATVIRLERNYRSTGHILAAAAHIIAYNEGRLGKTLRTDDELGEKVGVTGAWDSEEEARAVGEEIEQLQRGGHALNQIAILVRASFQMREFEDRFVTLGLPYRVIGGPRFYERAEIRDALAYLRVINSPADDLAFERIVNVPKRGLGDATVQLLHDHARKRRVPLTEAARAMIATDELKPKPRGALRGLLNSIDRWRAQRDTLTHTELAETVLDERGYTRCGRRTAPPTRRPAGEPERADPFHGGVREPARFSRAHLAGDGRREGCRRGRRQHHDAAFGRVLSSKPCSCPAGRKACFPTSARSTRPAAPAWKKSAASPTSASTARGGERRFISPPTGACTGCGRPTFPRVFSTNCRKTMSRSPNPKADFGGYGGYGASRFDATTSFGSNYSTPGWQRAQQKRNRGGGSGFDDDGDSDYEPDDAGHSGAPGNDESPPPLRGRVREGGAFSGNATRRLPLTIEGELVAKSTGTVLASRPGSRVFHQKFGNGNVVAVDGNKLTIAFDKAGEKRVVDSFVERVSVLRRRLRKRSPSTSTPTPAR